MAAESLKCRCVSLFLLMMTAELSGGGTAASGNSRVSLEDDLRPYAEGHGPSHSHRYVRDCQPVSHGNTTHESWPSSTFIGMPVAESTKFVTTVPGTTRWVYGHMTVVHDPLRSVSVLEPAGTGGCGMNVRATVEETAAASECLYAQNGGFFDTKIGSCLGNVVSNGRLVQDSGGVQNAAFGIKRDGTLVFGYLSQEDVLDETNPFVQLISGVVWLLRKGEVYIEQSLVAECDKTQETGVFRTFVDVVSARTGVGHDSQGRLVLFQIDGQTGSRGMNLWEFAEMMKKYGIINAINLDGGGSSTYVVNGALASYPSDNCKPDSRWRCARRISTILCVHQRRCQPTNCSGNGKCVDGRCMCLDGWEGQGCDMLVCDSTDECGRHGVCTPAGCLCDAGYTGKNCDQVCQSGFYGDSCNQTCVCLNGATCDPVHGRCSCPAGFHGVICDQECLLGFYGPSCARECKCDDGCPCDPRTGKCNVTLRKETNASLHRAGRCLAKQMFASLRREEIALGVRPHLSEQSWMTITVALVSLLSVSLMVHVLRACRRSAAASHYADPNYSLVPMREMNGASRRERDNFRKSGGHRFEDSDSQEEIWSPPRPGRM